MDASKWSSWPLVADAKIGLTQLSQALEGWKADLAWTQQARELSAQWVQRVTELTTATPAVGTLPYDAEVIGAVRESAKALGLDSATHDVVVCAAGTLPAELHKLWRAAGPGNYHMEYGYSCMGYEIAAGLGIKIARPEQEVIVMVGDGSYLMLNSEIATSVMLDKKIIVVVLDNGGYGCIQRLQSASGGASFNNMLDDCWAPGVQHGPIDFAMHAKSLGADAVHVPHISELTAAMAEARRANKTQVLVITTTHTRTTPDGGCWWEVAIPEVSDRPEVQRARADYDAAKHHQSI
jgi:3D-(3,5/4)-trihydroxycyclohexane-1,2-dione acylhydrolase (decyclizing)